MREELGIPPDATVFGRHGGFDVFDIFEAQGAVLSVARARPDIYFLFLNTRPLVMDEYGEADVARTPANIIHLPATMEDDAKQRFIRTCDAMLHARRSGETFGLAIAEFSASNRPVLTSRVHHDSGFANFHIETLVSTRGAQTRGLATRSLLLAPCGRRSLLATARALPLPRALTRPLF